ncbi:seven-hairpin glycosidase [Lindgomyces ingoldianus]|uniref:Seven-hairpin glycosidase n=1 Tax=Lindgomyces ingoldianus TaxID=673940 RepID=A0ACB6QTL2_9PLEO|nr:seven-hairpin glycosidase [Lindgomyces ingoldianus]KAF2470339.1 seven-hairpin glycosidase [Lindgomyces ingoldianus]
MLRYRRYRVFVIFAVIAVFALYKFGSSSTSWREQVEDNDGPKGGKEEPVGSPMTWIPRPQVAQETKKFDVEIPAAKTSHVLVSPPAISSVSRPVDRPPLSPAITQPTPFPAAKPSAIGIGGPENDHTIPKPNEGFFEHGEGRLEVPPLPSSVEPIHWKKQSEHFPIASKSLIPLPSGAPKAIPKIQFAFKDESPAARADREAKLTRIKSVFKRSWDGYRENAWLQDELSPVSGKFRNPFASWGATLVDALDTLWIMGFEKEFEEAVKAVNGIDFTTTPRGDIPLFETTIRYLGGLVAAYDISGMKHKSLIDKAVELAEILISAFDTPNRMPQTYYYWRPTFSSQAHRASNRIVLAEIGSLSVEFTRLAQVTGDIKYYDAIARITDQLEEFQNRTRLPGMWPTYLDASGCKSIDWTKQLDTSLQSPLELKDTENETEGPSTTLKHLPLDLPSPIMFVAEEKSTEQPRTAIFLDGGKAAEQPSTATVKLIPLDLPSPIVFVPGKNEPGKGKIKNWDDETTVGDLYKKEGEKAASVKSAFKARRQLDDTEVSNGEAAASVVDKSAPSASLTPVRPECEDQGFVSSSEFGSEDYTLGGMSDSTYEYLSKEYLLLGGQVEKYRTMFEQSMDVVKENLIFRPMLPNGDDILFSGVLSVPSIPPKVGKGEFQAENAHLTCFAGGMFAMGARIFNREEDLKIAAKLTEGCVWSYNMTSTGIMPEAFIAVPCESTKQCEWNETKYWEVLDPGADARVTSYEQQMETYSAQMASASAFYEEQLAAMTAPPVPTASGAFEAAATPTTGVSDLLKRQLDDHRELPTGNSTHEIEREDDEPPTKVRVEDPSTEPSTEPSSTLPAFPVIYSPKPPLTHEEYVKNRIQEERLPPGVAVIKARNYILRPEAIESVWYMYRITGDPHWREVGWRMFEAVDQYTSTVHGNSAIDDVTKTSPELLDEMESFWLAETIKYFYLLFAEEKVVSLDDWVLNTEAHPFRRPK